MQGIFSALLPMIILSSVFGVSQTSLDKSGKRNNRKQVLMGRFLPLLYLLMYTYAIVYLLKNQHGSSIDDYYNERALSNMSIFDYLGLIAATYMILLFNILHSNRLKKYVHKIHRADIILQSLGIEINFKRIYYYQILLIIFGFTFMLILIMNKYKGNSKTNSTDIVITNEFILSLPLVLIFLIEAQLAVVALTLYQRFCYINNTMAVMINTKLDTTETTIIKVIPAASKLQQRYKLGAEDTYFITLQI